MKFDLIVSGVGGQGILSISFVVDNAALECGLRFKQSEVHGMAQRGGAVVSHIRIADGEIFSDLVPTGAADLLLSMEPLETLRYRHYLAPKGAVVTSISPFINIPNYPDLDGVIARLQAFPNHTLVNAAELARAAGNHNATNMVMLGAAAHLMPIETKVLEKFIGVLFRNREELVAVNVAAFRHGAHAGAFYRNLLAAGMKPEQAAVVATRLAPEEYGEEVVKGWVDLCAADHTMNVVSWLKERKGLLPGGQTTLDAIVKLDPKQATRDELDAIGR